MLSMQTSDKQMNEKLFKKETFGLPISSFPVRCQWHLRVLDAIGIRVCFYHKPD